MDEQKVDAFFNALIDKTKRGKIEWDRGSAKLAYYGVNKSADFVRSFHTDVGNGGISLIMSNDGELTCYVKPELLSPAQRFGEPDNPVLLRLYNIIYPQKPLPFETFINSIIDDTV